MIVPDFWAEARKQHRSSSKQVTVRRYGWSTLSQADAQRMAEARVNEALERIIAGEPLQRREQKAAYNGANGIPIREEVLARHGEEVITRNGYGARCLNTPNALFADIDFDSNRSAVPALIVFAALSVASMATGFVLQSMGVALGLLFASLIAAAPIASLFTRMLVATRGGYERLAHQRIASFVSANPAWNVRIYRTPAGYRVVSTHQPFDAKAEEVQRFFSHVYADPVYVRMCTHQNCFRARLTAKPWRIGIADHMRPRPGVWPVQPEFTDVRNRWVARYEAMAAGFAACRYIESLGSGVVHAAIKDVVALHDHESRALTHAPIA